MDAHRCCRFKRKVFVLTAMLSGLMCFMLYTLSFSCCAVVDSARLHHRTQGSAGALYYGTDTEDGGQRGNNNNRHHRLREAHPSNRFMHKSLLEDSRHSERTREYSDSGLPHSPLQNNHKNNNNRLNFEGGEDSNNYVVEDDQDSDNSHHEYDTEEGYVNKNRRKIEITKSLPTGTKKLPTALIIGVKKGGTRALLEFIRVHPDVRAPGPEIHFFDRHFHRGIDWYRYVSISFISLKSTDSSSSTSPSLCKWFRGNCIWLLFLILINENHTDVHSHPVAVLSYESIRKTSLLLLSRIH